MHYVIRFGIDPRGDRFWHAESLKNISATLDLLKSPCKVFLYYLGILLDIYSFQATPHFSSPLFSDSSSIPKDLRALCCLAVRIVFKSLAYCCSASNWRRCSSR